MTKIHELAKVHPEARIGEDVEIGPFCTVGPHVRIGSRTKLRSHVVVEGWTVIGEDNEFFPFSVIGAIPQDLKYKGEATKLEIGNKNVFREGVTANLGTVQGGGVTRIGNNNLVMAQVHVGHDCLVGNNVILTNMVALAGHVIIDDFASVGGLCGVSQYVRVGKHAYIGGFSTLEKSIPPYCIAFGHRPCQVKGANIVGLKRRGFASDVISKINEAIKLWARSDVLKDKCLLEIELQLGEVPEVREFIEFIRSSHNGVTR